MPTVSPVTVPKLAGRWYIELLVQEPNGLRTWYALGPIEGWTEARGIAHRWETEAGPNTTRMAFRRANDRRFGKTPTVVQTESAPLAHGSEVGRCSTCGFMGGCVCAGDAAYG